MEEARALAAFRHPNIVRVLRYFGAQGTAYIVMEYESGQSLRQWLPRQPPLTRAALLALIGPLLDGLEAVRLCVRTLGELMQPHGFNVGLNLYVVSRWGIVGLAGATAASATATTATGAEAPGRWPGRATA